MTSAPALKNSPIRQMGHPVCPDASPLLFSHNSSQPSPPDLLPASSGVSQFCLMVSRATRPRATFARMFSAVAVQTSGRGLSLWAAR